MGRADSTACESARNLFARAAYLVVLVGCFPDIEPIDTIDWSYGDLLSAALLRDMVALLGFPGRAAARKKTWSRLSPHRCRPAVANGASSRP